jgi:microcystin-dependent protein
LDGASATEIGYLSGASSNIQAQINLKAPLADPTFTGTINAANLILSGNLTVNGTTTTLNSTTLTVDDKNIELGSVTSPTDITADGGGITLKGTTDKTFSWIDSTDSWTSSENIDLAANKKFTVASNPVMCPTGMLTPYAGTTAPDGWLLCAGQAVSRSTYAGLFAVVSTTYGSGDGSTTFNIPDLRGRTAVGKDDMGGTAANRVTAGVSGISGITLGATGGSEAVHQHSHSNTASFTGSAVTSGAGSPHTHIQNSHAHGFSGSYWMDRNSTGGSWTDTNQQWAIAGKGFSSPSASYTGAPLYFGMDLATATNQNESSHTHSVTASGTVAITNANFGSGSSQNMQPSIILNYIIKY